jgi:AAA-like domain
MNGNSALEFVDKLTFFKTGKHLNDLERQVFAGAWDGKTYEEIYPINPEYIEKDVGYKLWKKLSGVLGEKVTKKKIKGALERAWNERPDSNGVTERRSAAQQSIFIVYGDRPIDLSLAQQLANVARQSGDLVELGRETTDAHPESLASIDVQLRLCDRFILLLSPKSATSEMAIELLKRAKELRAAHPQHKPTSISIRVDCPPDLPFNHDLREYLNGSAQYELRRDGDISHLVRQILDELERHAEEPSSSIFEERRTPIVFSPANYPSFPLPVAEPELPSGQVRLASMLYMQRSPYDELCYKEIGNPGALVRIKAPRQMGKTSLMARILSHAQELGYRTVALSFQHADAAVFTSLNLLLQWFCAKIARKLRLSHQVEEHWSDYFGSKDNCTAYFEDFLLSETEPPLVLGLDEVDRVFQYPKIADDFFGLLRAWYEESGYGDDSSHLWQNLRLVVVHSTEVYVPLNVNQSPFNVGLPIELPEFTPLQLKDLAQRHGLYWESQHIEALMRLVGGHPYLTRLALYHIAQQQLTLAELLKTAATESGLYGDHLRRHLWSLQQHPELAAAFGLVLKSDQAVEVESAIAFKLHSMGLVYLQGNSVMPRFELYRQYFADRLFS